MCWRRSRLPPAQTAKVAVRPPLRRDGLQRSVPFRLALLRLAHLRPNFLQRLRPQCTCLQPCPRQSFVTPGVPWPRWWKVFQRVVPRRATPAWHRLPRWPLWPRLSSSRRRLRLPLLSCRPPLVRPRPAVLLPRRLPLLLLLSSPPRRHRPALLLPRRLLARLRSDRLLVACLPLLMLPRRGCRRTPAHPTSIMACLSFDIHFHFLLLHFIIRRILSNLI